LQNLHWQASESRELLVGGEEDVGPAEEGSGQVQSVGWPEAVPRPDLRGLLYDFSAHVDHEEIGRLENGFERSRSA
jgi:hypothetical protein